MAKQYSFHSNNPKLYIVATPIGNLQELTFRALEILKSVTVILCEDTRVSIKLLNHFNIRKKLVSLHKDNEKKQYQQLQPFFAQKGDIALISDAGYPLISDPGFYLIQQMILEQGYDIVPISGANAALNALVASGLPTQPFLFVGFLKFSGQKLITEMNQYASLSYTLIFYEAPHRMLKILAQMLNVFGDRLCCVAKEITKQHEQFYRGKISEILAELSTENSNLRGEFVIVMAGKNNETVVHVEDEILFQEIDQLIDQNVHTKEAIALIAKKYQIEKKVLYQKYHHKG